MLQDVLCNIVCLVTEGIFSVAGCSLCIMYLSSN